MVMKHSASAYRNGQCYCDVCTEDHRARHHRETLAREERLAEDVTLAEHGKCSTYANWGCRCEPCVQANAEHCRTYRARQKRLAGEQS